MLRMWVGLLVALVLSKAPAVSQSASPKAIEEAQAEWDARNERILNAYHAGQLAEGISEAKAAVVFAEDRFGGDHPNTLSSVNNLGFLYRTQGRYGEAESLFLRALEASERTLGKDHPNTLISVNNLGSLYQTQGRYGEAEPLYLRALEARERTLGKDHPDTLSSAGNLGGLYWSQGRYGEAEPLFLRALEASDRTLGRDHPDTLISAGNLGVLYQAQGRYGEAEPLFLRALEALERTLGKDHPHTLTSVNNLGFLYQTQGRYGETEPLYLRALEASERTLGKDHPDTLISVNNLGFLYQTQGRYDEAEPLYLRALEARERTLGGEHPDTAGSFGNLAALLHDLDRPLDVSIYYQKQAVNGLQAVRANMAELEASTQQAFLDANEGYYNTLQEWLIEAGRFAEAEQVGRMLKEEEYFDFIRRSAGDDDPRQTRIALTPLEQDISARLEELSARPNQIAAELAAFDPLRLPEGGFEPEVQTRYDAVLERYREAYAAYFDDVKLFHASITDQTSETQKEAIALNLDLSKRRRHEVAALGDDVALVQIVAFEDSTHFFVITPTIFQHEEIEVGRAELFKAIAEARELIDRPEGRSIRVTDTDHRAKVRAELDAALQRLDDLLVAPFEHHLEDAGTKTLMLNLQGAIRYAPFAAFHDGERYLTERFELALFNPVIEPNYDRSGDLGTAKAFGVSAEHPGFSPLPGVAAELEALFPGADDVGVLEGDFAIDAGFTRTALASALTSHPPVLHIASHFVMKPGNDTNSFLLLGDGDELRLLDIRTSPELELYGIELVTLSACSTAIGSGGIGAEVEGLGAMLHDEGVESVLATLWNVADDGTATFMEAFYTNMVSSGHTKAHAMQAAQIAMIQSGRSGEDGETSANATQAATTQPDYSHPYYWAPYVLMGNWK